MSRDRAGAQARSEAISNARRREKDLWPTTYTIAADIYQVNPNKDGNRWIADARHVAVKRALERLQLKGRIIGFRDLLQARTPGNSTGAANSPTSGRPKRGSHVGSRHGLRRAHNAESIPPRRGYPKGPRDRQARGKPGPDGQLGAQPQEGAMAIALLHTYLAQHIDDR